MKLLAAAIVLQLAYALVSIGQAHQVSTMYKTTPAMVGDIWSDCSKYTTSPTPSRLHAQQSCMHACMLIHVLKCKCDLGAMAPIPFTKATIHRGFYLFFWFQAKILTRPRLAKSPFDQQHQRKEIHCKSLQTSLLVSVTPLLPKANCLGRSVCLLHGSPEKALSWDCQIPTEILISNYQSYTLKRKIGDPENEAIAGFEYYSKSRHQQYYYNNMFIIIRVSTIINLMTCQY